MGTRSRWIQNVTDHNDIIELSSGKHGEREA